METWQPTQREIEDRRAVLRVIIDATNAGVTIKLPPFDPAQSQASPEVAIATVGIEPNPFGGTVGPYRYQFEGEEDLLHLIVTRQDASPLTMPDAQPVCAFLLNGVPPALVWMRPGNLTQHFFLGHDDLVAHVDLS